MPADLVRVESNSGIGLPVGFESMPMIVPDELYQRSPYVLFVHPRGANFAELKQSIPSLAEGDAVLIRSGVAPVKLSDLPFKFLLVRADRYFAQVDATGAIIRVTRDVENARKDKFSWKDHYETVLFVVLPDGLVPARCTFKTTKTNAAAAALKALVEAQTPEWADRSAAHKATLAIPEPRFRFTTTVTLRRSTGLTSGVPYTAANAIVQPLSGAEWAQLATALADDNFKATCVQINEEFERRLEYVNAKE